MSAKDEYSGLYFAQGYTIEAIRLLGGETFTAELHLRDTLLAACGTTSQAPAETMTGRGVIFT
jgi:hypothetical protein